MPAAIMKVFGAKIFFSHFHFSHTFSSDDSKHILSHWNNQ